MRNSKNEEQSVKGNKNNGRRNSKNEEQSVKGSKNNGRRRIAKRS